MEPQIGKRYVHYKGKEYTVLFIAHHTETLEKLVVYRAEYDDPEFGQRPVWVRPYGLFCGQVEVSGKLVQRFTEIMEND